MKKEGRMQGRFERAYGLLAVATLAMLLTACGSTSRSGGYYKDDGPGDHTPSGLMNTPDAQPRAEPVLQSTSRPYTVFGKRYVPITDNRSYKDRGVASWYGKKFHGNKTASGEIYDMYKMTAAHPILPIPSYARVTNLDNGKQVIVRINDRGPFHSGRIIDLSYTAAVKLGYIGQGSAQVEVERIIPGERLHPVQAKPVTDYRPLAPSTAHGNYYVQLGSFSQAENAESLRRHYALAGSNNLAVLRSGGYYRLMAGPFASREQAAQAALVMPTAGGRPIVVQH
ncbi:MAG: septal ring lytic transglycosylase RlpA family protein [Oxalobacter sp.]|nr:MAG: septal ring lytic transglycosylase RlpA family protein [Oxalobacter sp.]